MTREREKPMDHRHGAFKCLIVITFFLCSCSLTRVDDDDKIGAPFQDHPNPGVRYSADVGGGVGAIVGIPVMIIALPITATIAAITNENATPLAPLIGTSLGFSTLFGAVTWPLFGWWKVTDVNQPRVIDDKSVARPDWASSAGKDQYGIWADLIVGRARQRMRLIPAGSFSMGCDDTEIDAAWEAFKKISPETPRNWFAAPKHKVTLTNSYWLADSSCTQEFWEAIMGTNPARFHDDPQRPVEQVSWSDCQIMLLALSGRFPGMLARLPTEAEWEYACRAGTNTALYTGGIIYKGQNNAPALDSIAWYSGNSSIDVAHQEFIESFGLPESEYQITRMGTNPVKRKQPNSWGLYDMIGNVKQWCADWMERYPTDAVVDPSGPVKESSRVTRGSSWREWPVYHRCGFRSDDPPDDRSEELGFRICISAKQATSP